MSTTKPEALRIADLESQLAAIGAGYTAADMATAAAQGFRDGVTSVAASAGSEPATSAAGEVVGYRISDPSEPDLGHWLSEEPGAAWCVSEPLALAQSAKAGNPQDARPCHVFTVRKAGALTEWAPTTMALALPDGAHALYTNTSPTEGMVGGWIASKDQMPPPGVRVFWGDVDSHRVGYDSWAGDDYRWAPSHWMHIPEFPAPPTTSAGSGKGE